MSRTGEIVLPFGVEERCFRLGVEQWRKIQERCDAGPPEIARRLSAVAQLRSHIAALQQPGQTIDTSAVMHRLVSQGLFGSWNIDDVREPILQGLIGGGMDPTTAGVLVRDLVDNRPWFESLPIAYQVVLAGFLPPEDEPIVGEKRPAKPKTSRSRAAKSASPASTAPAS